MSSQAFVEPIASQIGIGTFFATYTTAKSVIAPNGLRTADVCYFRPGQLFRLWVSGGISNIVTTPGTIVFQLKVGSVVAWTSGNIQLNATAHTKLPFVLTGILRVDSVGSSTSAKLDGQCLLSGIMFTNTAGQTDAVNTSPCLVVPVTAPAVGTGFDSTASNLIDFWVGFSISDAANGVEIHNFLLEAIN